MIVADSDDELVSPEGTQEGNKEYLPSSSHQTAATSDGEPWGNLCESTILAPDSWGAYQRNDESPDACISSYIAKC